MLISWNYYSKGVIPSNYNFNNNVIQDASLIYGDEKLNVNARYNTWSNE